MKSKAILEVIAAIMVVHTIGLSNSYSDCSPPSNLSRCPCSGSGTCAAPSGYYCAVDYNFCLSQYTCNSTQEVTNCVWYHSESDPPGGDLVCCGSGCVGECYSSLTSQPCSILKFCDWDEDHGKCVTDQYGLPRSKSGYYSSGTCCICCM